MAAVQDEASGVLASAFARSRPALKLFALGLLVLLLGIPVMVIGFLSSERQSSARLAANEIARMWGGGAQVLSGPYLIVPYRSTVTTERLERRKDCPANATDCENRIADTREERQYLSIAPDTLTGATKLATEKRYRGIYETPVYTATSTLTGAFRPMNLTDVLQKEDEVLWEEAFLTLLVTDRRAFRNAVTVDWNGQKLEGLPGSASRREPRIDQFPGIHVPLPRIDAAIENRFAMDVTMLGGLSFGVIPNGRDVNWTMESDWPDPSFAGLFLPSERTVSATGFTATWHLPQIARQQQDIEKDSALKGLFRTGVPALADPSRPTVNPGEIEGEISVKLFEPVDLYARVDRSLKYALLFVGFVTLALYLIEVVNRDRAVHPVQYLFVGMANVVFYLLLLSLAEQIGFGKAYIVSAAATVGLIGSYCAVILREWRRALVVVTVLIALYVLLWVLLSLEDYALMVGSIMVFAALATTMYATRRINWYNPGKART